MQVITIATFGIFGVLCRYGIDRFFSLWQAPFPLSTFFINMLGCFLAGLVWVLGNEKELISLPLQTSLMVGFCGGFTTFSAYALQSLDLIQKNKLFWSLSYLILSPTLGLIAAYLGTLVARRF